MTDCHGCSRPLPPRARFCPACGLDCTPASTDDEATEYLPPAAVPLAPLAMEPGRELVPGTVLAGRFRVVALLGRGGMGEVYRCQDLRLGETVALKLLPEHLAQDPDARRRLDDEVRLARRVTHPHVCRVFDVVDLDTTVALSMEYIDGEDLSGLLRRVGHLAPQRALRVARQILLGVAAMHRQGLVHRDLKPANVMLDGRGDARVSDLGLASAVGGGGFAGTPAYMAPEQLAGGPATVRSDLWSLALVLHELFTGEPAFPQREAVRELLADRATPPPRLDAEALGLPDATCEAVQRCLAVDPRERPGTVEELLAAFPGGDALSDALAAGETPSPEAVAAGGPHGPLSAGAARAWAGVAVASLVAFFALVDRGSFVGRIDPELSAPVLRHRAEQMLAELGVAAEGDFRDGWFAVSFPVGQRIAPQTWEGWRHGSAPLSFTYGVSPRGFEWKDQRSVGSRGVPGEAALELSTSGVLRRLRATAAAGAEAIPARWDALLAAAGLPAPDELAPAPVDGFAPPSFADQRRAWRLPGDAGTVYAAATRGRPTYLEVVPPGASPPGAVPEDRAEGIFLTVVRLGVLTLLALGGLLAWRNQRSGRSDRRSALRLAAGVLALSVAGDLLALPFSSWIRRHLDEYLLHSLRTSLLLAALVWLLYSALEPVIRRRRPRAAIAWTRLLLGRAGDPLVGREVLCGLALGTLLAAVAVAEQVAAAALGAAVPGWLQFNLPWSLVSPVALAATAVNVAMIMLVVAFVPLLLWAWLLPALRAPRAATVATVLVMAALGSVATTISPTFAGVVFGIALALLSLHVGVIAAIVYAACWPLLLATALTADGDRFYFGNTPALVLGWALLLGFAYRAAVGRASAVPSSASAAAARA